MSYKKPTLTEIYTELHFEEGALPQSKFLQLMNKAEQIGLTEVEFGQAEAFKVDQASLTKMVTPRIRAWDSQQKRLLQLSPDIVVVNQVGDYLGWATFRELFDKIFNSLREVDALHSPPYSLSLNTIDILVVPQPGFRLGDFLHCGGPRIPSWYADTQEAADISMGRGMLGHNGFNRQLQLRVRPRDDKMEVRFELKFHNTLRGEEVVKKLEQLHRESNEWFESIITQKTRDEVMGGFQ